MKKLIYFIICTCYLLLGICYSSRDLVLSEVYLKGNADWLEISNIGDTDFSGTLTLSGATTPGSVPEYFDIDTSIASGQSTIIARYGLNSYSYFQNINVISVITSKLVLSATGRNIELWHSGSLLDHFMIGYQMVQDNNTTTSFTKKNQFGEVTITTIEDIRNVDSGYIASPGILTPPLATTGSIEQEPTSGNLQPVTGNLQPISVCIQDPSQIKISEVYFGDEAHSSFIEIQGISIFDDLVTISGTILDTSFTIDANMIQDEFLLISRTDNGLLSGSSQISDTRLVLLSGGGSLVLYGQNGQVLDSVQITPKTTPKSHYFSSGDDCQRFFETQNMFSPGFDEKFLYYFSGQNNEAEIVYISSPTNYPTYSCGEISNNQNITTIESDSPIKIISLDLINNIGYQSIKLQSYLDTEITFGSSSPYRLHSTNRTTNNVLRGTLEMTSEGIFTGNWRFPQSNNCIELLLDGQVVDRLCYDENTPGNDSQENDEITENSSTITGSDPKSIYSITGNIIKITSIDYDPRGSDTNNEKISLQLLSGESVDLSELRLKIRSRIAKIKGTLTAGVPQTFIGNYRFPNTSRDKTDIDVSLIYYDYVFDTYYYNPEKPEPGKYLVSSVIDGDTIRIKYKNKTQSVRLLGIDAPESNKTRYRIIQCYGAEAKKYLTDILKGREVDIQFDPNQDARDSYGRFIAYLYLDGELINQKLIQEGYAKEFTWKNAYQKKSQFEQSEAIAKNKNIGIRENCGGVVSGNIQTINPSDYTINITDIIYNPEGKDAGNETITLEVFSNEGGVTSDRDSNDSVLGTRYSELPLDQGFFLKIDNKGKSLRSFGKLKIGGKTTLKGTFGFLNSRAICVEIANGDLVFDKYCYDPNEKTTTKNNSGKDYGELEIQIKNILPNPIGKDAEKEEIGIFIDTRIGTSTGVLDYTGLDLSDGFYLLINGRKKKLSGYVSLGKTTQIAESFSFSNKAACVSIGHGDRIFDEFCYDLPQEGQKFVRSNGIIESMTDQDFGVLSLVKLSQIDNRLCVVYNGQVFMCKNLPASKTSIKLKNENKLYKNYIKLIENHLRNDRASLFYNTSIREYFDVFTQAKKLLKKGSQKVIIGSENVNIYDLNKQLILYEIEAQSALSVDIQLGMFTFAIPTEQYYSNVVSLLKREKSPAIAG